MECVLLVSVLTWYASTAFGFSVVLFVMFAFHLTRLVVFSLREVQVRQAPRFYTISTGGVGTIFITGFILVTSAICSPFQCAGASVANLQCILTPRNSFFGDEHMAMVTMEMRTGLVPLSHRGVFLA